VVKAAQEFVCVRLDAARNTDEARRFDVRGAPTVLMTDGQGNELARVAGAVEKGRLLARMAEARRGTESFRECQRQARRNPGDVAANWKVAQVCLDEGREDLADPYLRNVITYDENNRAGHTGEALLALGVLVAGQGRHAQAAYCYEQILTRWPKLAQTDKALYCLGLSRLATGEREKARAAFRRLVDEFPGSGIVPQAKQVLEKIGAK
jgi:tetratricopeptide (TPR) repeat protein